MLLPNYEKALIDPIKVEGYALNPDHLRGKHKARVFESALGLTQNDSGFLIEMVEDAIASQPCVMGKQDVFGVRYEVDFIAFNKGRSAVVRSAWIVKTGEDFPRLTTIYVRTKLSIVENDDG